MAKDNKTAYSAYGPLKWILILSLRGVVKLYYTTNIVIKGIDRIWQVFWGGYSCEASTGRGGDSQF